MPRQFRSDDTSIWTEQFGTGSNGAFTISTNVTQSPTDSACTGSSGATSLTATNVNFASGQNILIHQTVGSGAGNYELNFILSYTAGTITTKYPLQNTYALGAQVINMGNFTDVTVNNGVTFTAKQYNGSVGGIIGWIANGTTTINGLLEATTDGFAGGTTDSGNGFQGNSSTGTGSALTAANGAGGGGGGVGNGGAAGSGGGGGNGTGGANGTAGSRIAGVGGSTDGNAGLTDFNLGAGGGNGGFREGQAGSPGAGGRGAGGIFIISRNLVIGTGAVACHGTSGSVKTGAGSHGCGGGGAGGSIIFKSITATLGSNLVQANGGAGGVFDVNNQGGTGGSGRIHLDFAGSFTGTTTPTLDSRQDSSFFPSGGVFLRNIL